MLKLNPITPVQFIVKEDPYVPGEGASSMWRIVTSNAGKRLIHIFYCEWRGSHGEQSTAAQAVGVNDSATVRMCYNPDVYNALRTKQAVVFKSTDSIDFSSGEPDGGAPNFYELWGGVDNVAEENRFMEFRIRRYEPK